MEAIKSWIANSSALQNEALTKALQISLCDESSASEILSSFPPPPPPAAQPGSVGPAASRSVFGRTGNPKIAKRKPRPAKRSTTTFINAEPADFRRMVQEVTGIRFGEAGGPVEKWGGIEPGRSGMGRVGQVHGLLLDRSAGEGFDTVGPVVDGPVFEFEPSPSFPTLESWGM